MRIFMISDIHSNLPALKAVLKDIEGFKPGPDDQKVCLGDLVGYYSQPNEVIKTVKEWADIVLVGNHDHASNELHGGREMPYSRFNGAARAMCEWTGRELTKESAAFLRKLEDENWYRTEVGNIILAHSEPTQPTEMDYIWCASNAYHYFFYNPMECHGKVCFVGHTHVPQLYRLVGKSANPEKITDDPIDLSKDSSDLIVIPSVGKPRDGNPHAGYCIYDSERHSVQFRRLPYDISETQERMKEIKCVEPRYVSKLVERLLLGR